PHHPGCRLYPPPTDQPLRTLRELTAGDRLTVGAVIDRAHSYFPRCRRVPRAEAPTSIPLYAVWMMKDGINELERSRTNDRTKPTTKIRTIPARLGQSCGACNSAKSTAVAGTASRDPPSSYNALKKNARNMISSMIGANTIPKITSR